MSSFDKFVHTCLGLFLVAVMFACVSLLVMFCVVAYQFFFVPQQAVSRQMPTHGIGAIYGPDDRLGRALILDGRAVWTDCLTGETEIVRTAELTLTSEVCASLPH